MNQVCFNYQVLIILNGESPALLKLYAWMAHDLANNKAKTIKVSERYIRECTSIESINGRKASIPTTAACRHMIGRLVKLGCIVKTNNGAYRLPYESRADQEGSQ